MAYKKYSGDRMSSPLTQSDPFSGKKKKEEEKIVEKLEYKYAPEQPAREWAPKRMNEHRIHKIKDTSDPFAGTRTREVYIHPSEYSHHRQTEMPRMERVESIRIPITTKTKKKHTDWR